MRGPTPMTTTFDLEGKRPFEFPRPLYGLWQDVGYRCGTLVQSGFATFLSGKPGHRAFLFPHNGHEVDEGTKDLVRQLAEHRGFTFIDL